MKKTKTVYLPLPGHGSFWRMQRFFARHALDYLKLTIKTLLKPDQYRVSQLIPLRNQHHGQSCIVFGNGPSLSILDPNKVDALCREGYDLFCVNNFVDTTKFSLSSGASLVLSDPKSFTGDWISRYVNSKVAVRRIFVPHKRYSSDLVNRNSHDVEIYPFNDTAASWVFSRNIDPTLPRSYLSLTLCKALAIAVFLGYSRIYLCGLDNTYVRTFFVDSENRLYRKDEHFDSGVYKVDGQRNYHLSERYGVEGVAPMLMDYAVQFSHLHRFPKDRIFNLDPSSLIDAFSKIHHLDIYRDTV